MVCVYVPGSQVASGMRLQSSKAYQPSFLTILKIIMAFDAYLKITMRKWKAKDDKHPADSSSRTRSWFQRRWCPPRWRYGDWQG